MVIETDRHRRQAALGSVTERLIMNTTDLLTSIVDSICGAYPTEGLMSAQEQMKRDVCFALADHYAGMASNDKMTPAWLQANSGHAGVFNTFLQAQRIVRLSGSNALDFLDIEQLSEQVKQACNKAGLVSTKP